MKKLLFQPWLLMLAFAVPPVAHAQPVAAHGVERVDRVEPPCWWVGMRDEALQLMLHGHQIAGLKPRITYPGVRITSVQPAPNPNYLFINLSISPRAKPGAFDIVLERDGTRLTQRYELLAREPGSAQRPGFGNADVILNLVPDRFANGNPGNDNQPGFADRANRASDDAGRHGGDIQGIVDHLDYIAAMGYTVLWPTPMTQSNQPSYSYHGYAATDTYRIDPRYGSNDDYRRMVALARLKGIKVIQDVVLNHIGSSHWWMQDLPAPDWVSHQGRFAPTNHMQSAPADPYAAEVDKDGMAQGWFVDSMPDMHQRNPLVATYQIQNTIWWVEYAGLAGLRIDTYSYSDPAFLTEWSRRVMREYPRLNIVGEVWHSNPVLLAHWLGANLNGRDYASSLPSLMDFPLHETLRHALTTPESLHTGLVELYQAMVNDRLYPKPQNLVLFEGNHDVSRLYSALDEDLGLFKAAVAYVLTARRIPQFYYGTEILMTSPKHRDDGAFRRDFPGGWPGDAVNAFTGAGLTPEQLEAQAYVRRLLNWRKTNSAVHDGQLLHYAPEQGTYVYFRAGKAQTVMVVLNKNHQPVELPLARYRQALAGWAAGTDVVTGQTWVLGETLKVPAGASLILELKASGAR